MINSKRNYEGALLEEINSKVDRLAEILVGVVNTQKLHTQKLEVLEHDVSVIKSVITEHSTELKDHRSRINRLETKVFG